MNNYSKIKQKSQAYQLSFSMKGNGSFFIENDLPMPTIITNSGEYVYFAYDLDGFFHTKKNKEYVSDIVSRFLITFKNDDIRRLSYRLKPNERSHTNADTHRLREFQSLMSLTKEKNKNAYYKQLKSADSRDNTFWAIKYQAEHHIRNYGTINYHELLSWSEDVFREKERSTIRAKCRSIFEWYNERHFALTPSRSKTGLTLREYQMSKTNREHLADLNEQRIKQTKATIVGAIAQLNVLEKKINTTNIQKLTGLSRTTLSKYKDLIKAEIDRINQNSNF